MQSFIGMVTIKIAAVAIVLTVLPNQGAASVTIALDMTIDTPDRTVTYQGKNYEIQNIGAYSLGENVSISINVTDIRSFQLSLLDKDKNFLWNHMVYYTEGRTEVSMPADVVTAPGTYAFAVIYQGDVLAVKPVVFSRYKLSTIPDRTTLAPGGTLHVKVEVVPDTSLPMKIVLARNSSGLESYANRTGKGLYEAEIKIPASAYGRFSLYSAIASDNMILGYPELIGVSGGGIINVTEIPASSSTPVNSFSIVIASIFLAGLLILVFKKVRN